MQISLALPQGWLAPDQSELGKGWGQMHTRRPLSSECGDTQLTKGLNALLFFGIMKCPFSLYSKSWPQDFHNSTHQHNITTECNDLYQNASQINKLLNAKGNKIERVNVEPYRPFLLITNVVLYSPQTNNWHKREAVQMCPAGPQEEPPCNWNFAVGEIHEWSCHTELLGEGSPSEHSTPCANPGAGSTLIQLSLAATEPGARWRGNAQSLPQRVLSLLRDTSL